MKKIIAVVDNAQQHKEKNISILDYPMKNYITNRKLKKTFRYYYNNWKEYISFLKRKKLL